MEIKKGVYKHVKSGREYDLIAVGHDSDSLEEIVVYRGRYISEEFGPNPVWVRLLSSFLEEVEINGVKTPRFVYVKEA